MKTKEMTKIALFTAVLCIVAPMSIPIGSIPVSFTNLAVFLAVYLIGTKNGIISYLLYYLLGIFGLPVFSGYSGGLGKAAGPTGGFLIGFVFMALICGFFIEKSKHKALHLLGMILGTCTLYLFGIVWYCIITSSSPTEAFMVCAAPFIIGDMIKAVIAVYIGSAVKERLKTAQV
ncbi:MAG: biotin transporter BioY [Firmicutes bacterium]|nr:biotin transporter BioY [Bacillota bacterium]